MGFIYGVTITGSCSLILSDSLMGCAKVYVLLFGTHMQLIQIVGKNQITISQIVVAEQALTLMSKGHLRWWSQVVSHL